MSAVKSPDSAMSNYELLAMLLTLAAVFSYLNARLLHLPTTIGLMLFALLLSLGLLTAGAVWPGLVDHAQAIMTQIDFNQTLMHGMLGFLLFAGALHVDLDDLRRHGLAIGTLATVGVLMSTALVGVGAWTVFNALGIEMRLVHALLFGALISPTDPIAVLGILRRIAAPPQLRVRIAGESLFNDGIGVVVFLALLGASGLGGDGHGDAGVSLGSVAVLFAQEAIGGVLIGLGLGLIAYRMLRSLENYQVEILISLALVAGGYALCDRLHTSGPLAMVIAGLLIGNHGRMLAMSASTREHLDNFWELIDEVLNAVLFVLVGLEVLILSLRGQYLLAGALLIPLVLVARMLAVGLPLGLLRLAGDRLPHGVKIMTWGGLRGGISVAMALSIPRDAGDMGVREPILTATYAVVVFSILVQGLTVSGLIRRCFREST